MVEGAKRQKTPNEIALSILLTALTIVFLLVVVTLLPMSIYSVNANHSGSYAHLYLNGAYNIIVNNVTMTPTICNSLVQNYNLYATQSWVQANTTTCIRCI